MKVLEALDDMAISENRAFLFSKVLKIVNSLREAQFQGNWNCLMSINRFSIDQN